MDINKLEIVSIGDPLPPFEIKTITLWNPTVEQIKSHAEENPKAFVFTFLKGSVEDIIDYSDISRGFDDFTYENWQLRVVRPFYVGDMENPEEVADYLIKLWCKQDYLAGINLRNCLVPGGYKSDK